MKKILIFWLFFVNLLYGFPVLAGLTQLTHVSRANCINNESVSWQATTSHTISVKSTHYLIQGNMSNLSRAKNHNISSGGYQTSWRIAAIHWGEGNVSSSNPSPWWYVVGNHWTKNGTRISSVVSTATDCNKWDGWW